MDDKKYLEEVIEKIIENVSEEPVYVKIEVIFSNETHIIAKKRKNRYEAKEE